MINFRNTSVLLAGIMLVTVANAQVSLIASVRVCDKYIDYTKTNIDGDEPIDMYCVSNWMGTVDGANCKSVFYIPEFKDLCNPIHEKFLDYVHKQEEEAVELENIIKRNRYKTDLDILRHSNKQK
jgi:hypothetical protein